MTEVTRSNGTKTEVSYDAEDHITKIVNTCGSCGKSNQYFEYKYNDQGYVVGETATELEAGTRKDAKLGRLVQLGRYTERDRQSRL